MDEKNAVLVARKEYTNILVYLLYPAIFQGIKSIWEDAKRVKKTKPREVFVEFQNRLTRVRKWNQDVIDSEYKRIIDKTKCDYLEELIKRVFVINTQILAAVNMSHIDPNKKIKVRVPKGDKFIHCVYKECARAFFENALLMEDREGSIKRVEQSKNLQRAYKLIITCIENTIRNLLPIENLLRDSLEDEEGEDATPPAVLFHNPSAFSQHFWGRQTQQTQQTQPLHHPAPTHPVIPSSTSELEKMPLDSFPTLGSFLQNANQSNGVDNGLQNPSNGSLQPSMNELGTVPLPTEIPQDVHARYEALEKKDAPQAAADTDERPHHGGSGGDRSKFDPNSLFDSTDGGTDVNAPNEPRNDTGNANRVDENGKPETKTIYLGGPSLFRSRRSSVASQVSNRRPDTDYASEASDDDAKRDIGGVDDEKKDDFPVVRHSRPREKIDLDVYSSDNELPIKSSSHEEKSGDMESHRNSVPPLENGDSANFFSDVE